MYGLNDRELAWILKIDCYYIFDSFWLFRSGSNPGRVKLSLLSDIVTFDCLNQQFAGSAVA